MHALRHVDGLVDDRRAARRMSAAAAERDPRVAHPGGLGDLPGDCARRRPQQQRHPHDSLAGEPAAVLGAVPGVEQLLAVRAQNVAQRLRHDPQHRAQLVGGDDLRRDAEVVEHLSVAGHHVAALPLLLRGPRLGLVLVAQQDSFPPVDLAGAPGGAVACAAALLLGRRHGARVDVRQVLQAAEHGQLEAAGRAGGLLVHDVLRLGGLDEGVRFVDAGHVGLHHATSVPAGACSMQYAPMLAPTNEPACSTVQ
ncbi:hypothetical protein Henu3_gp40 [Mycobacterium phage Henu3]|uniref:Uncharacterized protein n=1 Tax=Mycobacterium phage Henu3 TaxID=2492961 RepID=A0A410T7M0_9CAUD|nr:hypothetical protein I5G68_gp37 [Mycobacterium phage Henu3]QAU04984.1 hypothetical protein Henu3_gp40 [Mycobacterium phage Henu3]